MELNFQTTFWGKGPIFATMLAVSKILYLLFVHISRRRSITERRNSGETYKGTLCQNLIKTTAKIYRGKTLP